ncbi:MAG TPA: DUF4389 domain-containing protein [Gammaproteobacteria bacterium]|nr:DUF4389 domain-containing protein [Gammaproteobacteria bacterium]
MADEKNLNLEQHLQSKSTWLRLFYMIVLGICFGIAESVATVVVLFQFFHVLFTGEHNANLLRFGEKLSLYFAQIARYMTYNTEARPFPFAAWGETEAAADVLEPADER